MNNREELTRQAEKCLRQGRLDEAITLLQVLAEVTPVDWNVVKQLADLLERAGQREAACVQFSRWADYLFAEGFHPKAAALFKKVLKLEPNHEHALWQLAEVSIALKLRADARVAFGRVAELRQRRNDAAGAEHARRRIAELDGPGTPAPSPFAGLSLAPAPATPAATTPEPADPSDALASFSPSQAPAPGVAAVVPSPAPIAAPSPASVAPAAGAVEPPAPIVEAPAARLARLRDEAMRAEVMLAPDAAARWHAVLDAAPDDLATRLRLVRRALERRDYAEATSLSTVLDPEDDASFTVLVELAVAGGRTETVADLASVRVAIGGGVERTLAPAATLARRLPAAARAVIVEAAAAWTSTRQPHLAGAAFAYGQQLGVLDAPACVSWVETCSDDASQLAMARTALAEAYLAIGRAADARAVAEAMCESMGDDASARHLLLRAVTAEGHHDPAGVVARILAPTIPEPQPEPALDLDLDLPIVAAARDSEPAGAVVALGGAPKQMAPDPAPWTVLSLDDDLDTMAAETFATLDDTPSVTPSVDDTWLEDVELADVVPPPAAAVTFESPRGVGHYVLDDVQKIDEPLTGSPMPADAAPAATLEDWLGPIVAATSPTPAPAVVTRSDFDWADLLGRDLGYGGEDVATPADPAVDAEAQAAVDVFDEPAPVAALTSVSTHESALVDSRSEDLVPATEVRGEAVVAPETESDGIEVVEAPAATESGDHVTETHVVDLFDAPVLADRHPVDAGEADAPIRDDGTRVDVDVVPVEAAVPEAHDVAELVAPVAVDTSMLAVIAERQVQPDFVADGDPLLPALSTPRAWLTGATVEPGESIRTPHPEDAYLFEEPDPTPFFLRRRGAPPAPTVGAPEPLVVVDDVPAPAAVVVVRPDEPTGPAPQDEPSEPPVADDLSVDEEIDLTQLLEELKQWDPVLPEPRRRSDGTAAATAPDTAPPAETESPLAAEPVVATGETEDASDIGLEPQPLPAQANEPAGADEAGLALDAAFADLQRAEDGRVVAEQQLAAGRVFLAAGLTSEAARSFERASSEPRTRFEAAQALAGLHHSRGQLFEAVQWFESAAAAPVPDAAVKRPVLYDLAESLEALGEPDRALGVLLDLLSQVEDYRDARVRLDRLLSVDAGG